MILVTTQVCEMSLDLDADVLITEVAPVPSLIQRMGRCCRRPHPEEPGTVLWYLPPRHRPYERQEIDEGAAFLLGLPNDAAISQQDLAERLDALEISDPFARGGYVGFLDSGPYAMARDDHFREDDDFAVDCVLDADLEAFLQMRAARNNRAAGFVLPAPRRLGRSDERLGGFLRVAPASHYSSLYGLMDDEVTQ